MSEYFLFVLGIVLGAVASWVITHLYYLKSSTDQKIELSKLADKLNTRKTLEAFEEQLTSGSWSKSIFHNKEVWISDADNTLQIEQGDQEAEFGEPWTEVYPNPRSFSYPIFLKINNVIIKRITFVSVDGGRIFVPIPSIRVNCNGSREFFWDLESLDLKVCEVVGSYYIYGGLEGVAKMSHIFIENSADNFT